MQPRRYTIQYLPLLGCELVILVTLALLTSKALALFYPLTYHNGGGMAAYLDGPLVFLLFILVKKYHSSEKGQFTFGQLAVVLLLTVAVGAVLGVVSYFL